MKSPRLLRRVATAVAVLATLLSIAPAALAATSVYFSGAVAGKQARPAMLALTADGTLEVDHVTWISWGGPTAIGSGTAEYHGCTPNCASGKGHVVKVAVVLSHVVSCAGTRYYDHVALLKPKGTSLKVYSQSWAPCHQ
jgi:hypothetical protein